MRILLVSYFFPPYNTIGAVRVGKTAKYLRELGHEVRVLTARDQPLQPTLPTEVPEADVIRTPWINVNRPAELLLGGRRRVAARGYAAPSALRSVVSKLGHWYRTLVNFPDGQIGWLPFAVWAGSRLLAEWRPDVILASSKPVTSLLVAARLARQHAIPWVAELRDLFVDDSRYVCPRWRRALETRLERWTLDSATALVTVSQPYVEHLVERFHKPTEAILNGFDPHVLGEYALEPQPNDMLNLAYTGMVYNDSQDVTPLLKALALLKGTRPAVKVRFYGRYLDTVQQLADRHGVGEFVEVHDSVAYEQSLAIQRQADVLLMLLTTGSQPLLRGVYTGKLFEYIGARRPILAIGETDNVAAELIGDRQAGVVLRDPAAIAGQLQRWIALKSKQGHVPAPPPEAVQGLSRREQVARLEAFLRNVAPNSPEQKQGPHWSRALVSRDATAASGR